MEALHQDGFGTMINCRSTTLMAPCLILTNAIDIYKAETTWTTQISQAQNHIDLSSMCRAIAMAISLARKKLPVSIPREFHPRNNSRIELVIL
jgi:hypothetical protein